MEFSVGNALGTSFRVWFRNFAPFTLLNALIHVPIAIWMAVVLRGRLTLENADKVDRYLALGSALGFVLTFFTTAALIYGVVMELRGTRASMGACLRVGLVRFFPALGAALLMLLCIGGGAVLLVVPGIIFWCTLYVTVPASVVERPGVLGALKRSAALTKGLRVQIFGLLLITLVVGIAINQGIKGAFFEPKADPLEAMAMVRKYMFANIIVDIVTGVFGAVLAGVTYVQLRASKEGTSAEELARVFD